MSFQKARDLINDSILFESIVAFNTKFKESSTKPLVLNKLQQLLYDKDSSLFIFKRMQEPYVFIPFYKKPQRLCLIDKKTLEHLALYLGASVLHKSLLNILFKKDREYLFSFLDKKIYDFTLSYARYALPLDIVDNNIIKVDELYNEILKSGFKLMLSLCGMLEDKRLEEYYKDIIDNMCPNISDNANYNMDDTQVNSIYKLCIHILTKEIDSKWLRYFA